ncbi:Cytochrome P450 monooxygenase [Hyphodiscus hymeniophilus]|uniref:Cytochrome P450 monooxygenase n=1 Tax=Hyphodiscus hymeniophilus TaxID=353542 RepID=A0A9P6VK08_9HELO|nr:Cytochrome P450 monooxygenase [Hyphodiscus hymeniophilus]
MEVRPNSTASVVLPRQSFGVSSFYIYGTTLFIIIATISWIWFNGTSNTKEPPQISPKVPFIGHLLGIIQHQAEYFLQLRTRQSWPIFTLKIFGSRIYVITSPELVQAVFRNSKSLSFEPIAFKGSQRILQMGKEEIEKLGASPDFKHADYMDKINKGMHASLQPGAPLFEMNSRALNRFAVFLNEIDTTEKQINLYTWVRDHFTLASADAMYGEENPIAEDLSLIDSLHYSRGLVKNASGLIQARYRDITASGCTADNIADWEIAIVMATTMNSVNGAFWMLCHVFSDPQLVSDLREEIEKITTRRTQDGTEKVCFDVSQLQKSCPLLTSAWQETLRAEDVVVSQRVVVEDTMLNDTYFLKKNSMVQIPSRIMHESSDIWGADSHIFNARRFLKPNVDSMSREQRKLQKQGFVPFGGGSVLCPGRHFATTETLGIAATILLGYELRMADGSGALKVPKGKKQEMGVAVKIPQNGLDVLIQRKKEFEGVKWTYDVGGEVKESDMVF